MFATIQLMAFIFITLNTNIYKTIALPRTFVCVCVTWYSTLREEEILGVRGEWGSRMETTWGLGELHNEEPWNFYDQLNIVTDLFKVLLGNGSVNTFQHTCPTKQQKRCFLCVRRRDCFLDKWRLCNNRRLCFPWCLFVAFIGTESRTKGMGIQPTRNRIGESSWAVQ
jgi:hypothetical protein